MDRPPRKKPTSASADEDVVMGGDEHASTKPSFSAPEEQWAQRVKGGNLFAGLSKGTSRKQSKPTVLTIPLEGKTEGGKEIGKNLRAQEKLLSNALPAAPTSSTAHPNYEQANAPTWGIGSLESVRTSIGFLEEHLNSLVWVQECLISHQRSLVRTRLFTQTFLDSVAKAMYVQNRFKDMKEIMTGERREGSEE